MQQVVPQPRSQLAPRQGGAETTGGRPPRFRRTSVALAAAAAVGAVGILAGCSGDADTAAGAGDTTEVKIAVITPLSGLDRGRGAGALNAVKLAVNEANAENAIPGYTLVVEEKDDKAEADVAAAVSKEAADDPDVVAAIGSVYSGTTRAAVGPLQAKNIALVTPGATATALTRGDAWATKPARQYDNLFRACVPDDFFAPAMAEYLRDKGVNVAGVVNDGDDYGTGYTTAFASAFTQAGGKIVDAGTIDPDKAIEPALIDTFKKGKVEAVAWGGLDVGGGALSIASKNAGLRVPQVGGDGMYSQDYLFSSGIESAGDMASLPGVPPDSSEAGQAFLAAYRAQRFDSPVTMESLLGYDAAKVLIEALKTSLPQSGGDINAARPATIKALGTATVDGLTGNVAFDQYGDPVTKVGTIYRVSGGQWVPEKTLSQ